MANTHKTTKDKILTVLLSNKQEEFSIRAIAKRVAVDYKTVYLIVQKLIKDNIIQAKKAGQTILCSINQKEFNNDIFIAEHIRKEELLKKKDFYSLYTYFKDIKKPFFILLLFGSHASGKARKNSDIDFMLIVDDDKVKRQIKQKISLIPLKIHLVDFTSEEFISMLRTTEFNVGREAFNNNIVLFGIEDYYRLIQHV